jgi:DNA repair protein RadC
MDTAANLSNLGEVEVSYKYHSTIENRPVVQSPNDAFEAVMQLYDRKRLALQEQFVIIFLNRAQMVIGSCNLFSGSNTACVVDIKLILAIGLKLMASGIIISHNHPSGKLVASEQDIKLTKSVKEALEIVEMKLFDHIIVSPHNTYLSLSNEGQL